MLLSTMDFPALLGPWTMVLILVRRLDGVSSNICVSDLLCSVDSIGISLWKCHSLRSLMLSD